MCRGLGRGRGTYPPQGQGEDLADVDVLAPEHVLNEMNV